MTMLTGAMFFAVNGCVPIKLTADSFGEREASVCSALLTLPRHSS